MRKQKEIWEREHETSAMLPSHDSEKADDNKLAELAEKLRKLTLKK